MSLDLEEAFRMTLKVARVFEGLDVSYVVVGSIASSIHGLPRTTEDIDLVADLKPEHVTPLVEALGGDFYLDESRIRSAIRRSASFNMIHLKSLIKLDVFVLKDEPTARREMERRRQVSVGEGEDPIKFQIASPEDVVLQKLLWYRLGNEVSERQWRDVLGVLKVQRERLDFDYMNREAERLDVADLLMRAQSEV